MELSQVLENLGLKPGEASVYLALLQLGPSPVLAISRRTGLKRPTIYLILDELMKHGFVARVPQEKKKLFLALPPERLKEKLERQTETLAGALPQLTALYKSQSDRPAIQIFESREGMMNIYHEIVASGSEILSFFALEAIPEEFMPSADIFIQALKQNKARIREIAYTRNKNHYYFQKTKGLANHQVRFIGEDYRFFSDNFIYGNKIAVFSFKKRFALVIESEDLAKSFRSLFELAWQSAKS